MFTLHLRRQIAIVACVATAITLLCWACSSKPRHNQKEVAAAEDEVYEAVVRDMIRQTHVSQLVFGDTVLTDLLRPVKLPYDSLADKLYRLFTPKGDVDSLRAEATRDFAEKSCTAGPLSQAGEGGDQGIIARRVFARGSWLVER